MGKRKRVHIQHHDPVPKTFVTKFGIVEVDEIIEEGWKFQKLNDRRKDIYSKHAVQEGSKGADDHISIMPDDVLQLIISYLPMREGAHTSILSRRWKNLWSSCASALNFDAINIFGRDYKKQRKSLSRKKGTRKFIDRVDQILKHRRGRRIDSFRVCSSLDKDSTSSINQWVALAASQGVSKLDLNFLSSRSSWTFDMEKLYKFPLEFFNHRDQSCFLRHLHLKFCILSPPRDVQSFKSLLSLSLKKTWISQEVLTHVMVNCSFLEWLSLNRCFLPKSESVKFAGTYLHLKHLSIFNCSTFTAIELDAENLISFEYSGIQLRLSFKHVPRLLRVYICINDYVNLDGLTYILNKLPTQLETLCLSKEIEEFYLTEIPERKILPTKLPIFANLKQLALSIATTNHKNLVELTSLLEVCPMLQKLQLDLIVLEDSDYRGSEEVRRPVTRRYEELKEIDIYGFRGYGNEIELVTCLLKGSTGLETMEIYTDTPWCYCGDGGWSLADGFSSKSNILLREARKLLQKELRPTTKLIIFSPPQVNRSLS